MVSPVDLLADSMQGNAEPDRTHREPENDGVHKGRFDQACMQRGGRRRIRAPAGRIGERISPGLGPVEPERDVRLERVGRRQRRGAYQHDLEISRGGNGAKQLPGALGPLPHPRALFLLFLHAASPVGRRRFPGVGDVEDENPLPAEVPREVPEPVCERRPVLLHFFSSFLAFQLRRSEIEPIQPCLRLPQIQDVSDHEPCRVSPRQRPAQRGAPRAEAPLHKHEAVSLRQGRNHLLGELVDAVGLCEKRAFRVGRMEHGSRRPWQRTLNLAQANGEAQRRAYAARRRRR